MAHEQFAISPETINAPASQEVQIQVIQDLIALGWGSEDAVAAVSPSGEPPAIPTLGELLRTLGDADQQAQLLAAATPESPAEAATGLPTDIPSFLTWINTEEGFAFQQLPADIQGQLYEALGILPGGDGGGTGGPTPFQQQQLDLQLGGLLGTIGGEDTLALRQFMENTALDRAGLLGYLDGEPTFAREQFLAGQGLAEAGVTGYLDGVGTLARERFSADQAYRDLANVLTRAGLTGFLDGAPTLDFISEQRRGQEFGQELGFRQSSLQQQLAAAASEFEQQMELERGQSLGFLRGRPTLSQQGLAGILESGSPTLESQLGFGELALGGRAATLSEQQFLTELIRNPTNFLASQLLSRGPGATVGDLQFPGAVGGLLFGGGVPEMRSPSNITIPSLQDVNRATPGELAAAGAGFQFLTRQPQENLVAQIERLGLRGF